LRKFKLFDRNVGNLLAFTGKEQASATRKQSVEAAQQIEHADYKASALGHVASDLASDLAKAGDFEQAEEVAQEIESAEYKASALGIVASYKASGLSSVATDLAKAGDFTQALEVAHKIEHAGHKVDALAAVASWRNRTPTTRFGGPFRTQRAPSHTFPFPKNSVLSSG
jgi:thioredoxin-like negative regulator of GroEL